MSDQNAILDWSERDYTSRANIHIKRRNFDEAITVLQDGLKKYSENARLASQLGYCYHRTDDLENAVSYFSKALVLNPDNRNDIAELAIIYLKQDKKNEALANLESAHQRFPEDPFIVILLGRVYYQTGCFEKSAVHYEKALRLGPDKIRDDFFIFAMAYAAMNKFHAAKAVLKRGEEHEGVSRNGLRSTLLEISRRWAIHISSPSQQ